MFVNIYYSEATFLTRSLVCAHTIMSRIAAINLGCLFSASGIHLCILCYVPHGKSPLPSHFLAKDECVIT